MCACMVVHKNKEDGSHENVGCMILCGAGHGQ